MRLLIGLSLGAFAIFFLLWTCRIKLSDTPATPQMQDWINLDQAVKSFREYSKTHEGEYPDVDMPVLMNDMNSRGYILEANLKDTRHPPVDSKSYAFLYFPLKSRLNKDIPFNDPSAPKGLQSKILAASLNSFVGQRGNSYRIVEFYFDDASEPMEEADFQAFLEQAVPK